MRHSTPPTEQHEEAAEAPAHETVPAASLEERVAALEAALASLNNRIGALVGPA